MRIAIQGENGSFHHQVAMARFGETATTIACETFNDVFGTLNRHEAEAAVVAVENSLYGSINEVLDLIESHGYPIVGEEYLRIEQQLIALPDADPKKITRIYSHPVALAQCEQYLDANFPQAERIEYHDTAASVELIKKLNDPSVAAVAGRHAASLHHLPILAENIEDNKANFTRFLVLSPSMAAIPRSNKASLVLTTDHTPGALGRALTAFANQGANLTKLQSRPIIGQPWKYRFYIDVEITVETLDRIAAALKKDGVSVTVLGTYKAATT